MKRILKHKITLDSRFYYLVIMNIILICYSSKIFLNNALQDSLKYFAYYVCFNVGFLGLVFIVISLIPNKKISNFLVNTFVIFCILFACIEIFLLAQFRSLMQPLFMDIFLSTNLNETREFLDFYINANLLEYGDVASIPYIIIIFIIISIIFIYIKLPKFNSINIFFFIVAGVCFGISVGKYKYSNSFYRFIVSFQGATTQSANISMGHNKFLESMKDHIKTMKLAIQNNNGGGGVRSLKL